MNLFKFIFSFLYPVTVEEISGKYNPVLEVRIENGKYVLNAALANYSFGKLHQIFLNAFKQIKIGEKEIKNVLLLGFGGGSVPVLLFEKFKMNCKITAVEIDQKVIDLGKKYFNIQRFENLELICDDALEYVKNCNLKFDLVVVDIFIDNKVPSQFESGEFLASLKSLMKNKSILLFNKIVELENEAESFAKLVEKAENIFSEIQVLNIYENKLIVANENTGTNKAGML